MGASTTPIIVLEGVSRAQIIEDVRKLEPLLGSDFIFLKTSELFLHERSMMHLLTQLLTADKPVVMAQSFYWHLSILTSKAEKKLYMGFVRAFELLLLNRPSLLCFTEEALEKGLHLPAKVPYLPYKSTDMSWVQDAVSLILLKEKPSTLTRYDQPLAKTVVWLSELPRFKKDVYFPWDDGTAAGRTLLTRLMFLLEQAEAPQATIICGRAFPVTSSLELDRVQEAVRQPLIRSMVVFGTEIKQRAKHLFPNLSIKELPYMGQSLTSSELLLTYQELKIFFKHNS